MAEVEHEERGERGEFYLLHEGERAGRLYYRREVDRIVVHHTEVGEALRGQGAGKRLVEGAAAWARSAGLKIEATCPFARKVIEREPSLQDVLVRS